MKPQLLAVSAAALELPVTEQTIWKWIKDGQLPVIRLGKKVFIKRETLDLLLSEGLQAASHQKG